jgi:hypothetical protein
MVYGKPGNDGACFPHFPQTVEIDEADSHIHHDDEDEFDPQNPAG